MKAYVLIGLYLAAIVAANLSVAYFGLSFAILNQFFLIGLDLTCRDSLHDIWRGHNLAIKMALLIATGSLLSALLAWQAIPIAIASSCAFALTGLADYIIYSLLGHRPQLQRMNGSNLVSAGVDSIIFMTLAFGWPPLWGAIAGQYLAKVLGGAFWAYVLTRWNRGQVLRRPA